MSVGPGPRLSEHGLYGVVRGWEVAFESTASDTSRYRRYGRYGRAGLRLSEYGLVIDVVGQGADEQLEPREVGDALFRAVV